ncbi:uncharacterized protein [Henckelia pumila]|uniref:uncharacterized protein isoform X1 n=1 Tax=Henckelia pumila TaxID=405737 RepID=UPI003C6DD1F0
MKVVNFDRRPDTLLVKEVRKPKCEEFEILIQVSAAGLNFYDTFPDLNRGLGMLQYTRFSDVGYECAGKVVAVGRFVRYFKVGDQVCAILQGGGGCAEFATVSHRNALKIPPRVTLNQAAALPVASCLTFYALSMLTNIGPGKTILIHGDAGGVDVIAIQYAKHVLRCEVIAVAGMEEKLRLCRILGAKVCINYKKEDFCRCVKAETRERGVDIILDASGRADFRKNLDCLAKGGSLVVLGSNCGSWVDIDLSVLMDKDINVIGGDLRNIFYSKIRSIFHDAAAKIWPLIQAGHIKLIIGKEFSFSEATEAYRALAGHNIAGKILLVSQ